MNESASQNMLKIKGEKSSSLTREIADKRNTSLNLPKQIEIYRKRKAVIVSRLKGQQTQNNAKSIECVVDFQRVADS